MPEITVWPVSSSETTRKVGSSSARRASEVDSLSSSALVLGSIATEITGSGNTIDSSTIGWRGSHSVSPVPANLRPTAAPSSPANIASRSSRWLACICSSRLMRSLRSFVEL